jgi:4-hydroxythreonine-4-phosphate dehydrogenase
MQPDESRAVKASVAAPLALTMGDPAGIGLDITIAAWLARHERSLPPFVFLGDPDALARRAALLGHDLPIARVGSLSDGHRHFATALPVLSVPCAQPVHPGTPDTANGQATIAAIEQAVTVVMTGEARAIVTNPIAKSVLYASGFAHPGHTEFLGVLADQARPGQKCTPVMMLASDVLKVVPVTIHVPLAAVPGLLTADLLMATIRATHHALIQDFGIVAPRIAVTGLNPHAGESGTIGTEDRDLIAPVIAQLIVEGMTITGPHPADTLFHATARTRYDAVVAMYHDQALIPIKTLAFDSGVNVTLGLPFVRTSPDHGTAFDIAGTGRASPESLIQALLMADRMATARARGPA